MTLDCISAPTPAFGYIRVSHAHQLLGDGPERQETAIRAHAAANNLFMERIFIEAETGTMESRAVWMDMIAAMGQTGVKVVVIERLDRLARELGVQECLIRDMMKLEFEIQSAYEPDLMSTSPTRVLVRQVLGAIAQYDRAQITTKMRAARDRMRQRGEKCEGQHAYGHHPGKPEEKAILEHMQALHSTGKTFLGVTKALNNQGIKPRSGSSWHYATVQRILQRRRA